MAAGRASRAYPCLWRALPLTTFVLYGCRVHSREVIRRLQADGWTLVRTKGSHHHFRHPVKPGLVTVPHPKGSLPLGTLKSIERQSGVSLT